MLTTICTIALFGLEGHKGFSLWDEGFLWYGAQRVTVGEVPIRDFQAYDIGRYYWSAAFMSLMGDNGIVVLRMATAVFQAIALYIGLTVVARNSANKSYPFMLLVAITLAAWMTPQYKLFDISIPIMLVGTLALLVEQPSRRRYFLTGLIVGLVAVFGRNHGMYGVVGSMGTIIFLTAKRESNPSLIKAFSYWVLGVVVGYLPVLVFLAVVPGFALAFWEGIRFLFEYKATNIPLPVPWPWLVPSREMSTVDMLRDVTYGFFFIAIVVFGLLGIVWAIRQRLQNRFVSPILMASIFLALPYAHYAYSRADIEHLVTGISPFLMGAFALLVNQPEKIKWSFATLLCVASLLVMMPYHPGWYCYSSQQCVDIKVAGDQLKVGRRTAIDIEGLNKLAEQFAPGDRTFIATPLWPGAYAALGRKSPMWEIFALTPRSAAFQQAEIERIKTAKPGFVVIYDFPLDGRDDLRFHNTHPLIDQYIRDNFETVLSRNPAYQIYRMKQAGQ